MLEVLYATGIRVSELISLDIENVNLSGCFIVCTGKGKSRIIPLYQGAVKALSDYIKTVSYTHLRAPSKERCPQRI